MVSCFGPTRPSPAAAPCGWCCLHNGLPNLLASTCTPSMRSRDHSQKAVVLSSETAWQSSSQAPLCATALVRAKLHVNALCAHTALEPICKHEATTTSCAIAHLQTQSESRHTCASATQSNHVCNTNACVLHTQLRPPSLSHKNTWQLHVHWESMYTAALDDVTTRSWY